MWAPGCSPGCAGSELMESMKCGPELRWFCYSLRLDVPCSSSGRALPWGSSWFASLAGGEGQLLSLGTAEHLIFACLAGAEAPWSSTQPTAAAPRSRSWCRQDRSSSRYRMWGCGNCNPQRGTVLILLGTCSHSDPPGYLLT